MRSTGTHLLAITTAEDPITGEPKPLFAFPVGVCSAISDNDVKFDIAAPSGAARETVYRDPATGELVNDEECPRGVRVGDEFHAIDREVIEQINEATKVPTMIALGTINLEDVPFERATGTYFLQSPPKGGAPSAYKLVYEALRATKKGKTTRKARAIITKRTARSRQKLCVIYADESLGCLMMVQLRFAGELRAPDNDILAPQTAQTSDEQINMARQVIDGIGDGMLALENEKDDAVALKQELIEKALAGEAVTAPPITSGQALGDLDSLLEASLAEVQASA